MQQTDHLQHEMVENIGYTVGYAALAWFAQFKTF